MSILKYIACAMLLFTTQLTGGGLTTTLNSSGKTVVVFGDELASGIAKALQSQMKSIQGVNIVDAGKTGDTSEFARLRVKSVTLSKPDVVLLVLGGNDIVHQCLFAKTQLNLNDIVSEFKDCGSKVIVLGMQSGLSRDYVILFSKLCEYGGTEYISDILEGLENPFTGGKLLTTENYEHMALRTVIPITKVLRDPPVVPQLTLKYFSTKNGDLVMLNWVSEEGVEYRIIDSIDLNNWNYSNPPVVVGKSDKATVYVLTVTDTRFYKLLAKWR